MVVDNLPALEVLDLHIIAALLLVPCCAGDLVPRLDVFVQSVLSRKIVKVGINLPGARVHSAPVELGLERPCVVVCGHVARAAAKRRISVLPTKRTGVGPGRRGGKTAEAKRRRPGLLQAKPTTYPGYLFSNHVPETSEFFSYTVRE